MIKRDVLDVSSPGFQGATITGPQIISEVCRKYRLSRQEVLSCRRQAGLVLPRQEIFYRMKRETSMTFPQMGRLVGKRDHTTAMYSARRYEQRLAAGEVSL